MADKISTLADELAGAIRESGSRKTSAYDTPATVRRIDGSTAWVHIPGGVDETPVQLTIAASVGDTVQVRVSGGRAWMVGNASAPPTDDRVAVAAREKADEAAQVAEAAETLGTEAREVARAAAKIAADTEQHFWFTETGADTGAHITEVTREEFLADPDSGGGNLLARSNGIAVRDGLAELAQFSANGAKFFTLGDDGSLFPVVDISSTGESRTMQYRTTEFDGAVAAGTSETIVTRLKNPTGSISVYVYTPGTTLLFYDTTYTAGTSDSDSTTIAGLSISITYDGSNQITTILTASNNSNFSRLKVEVQRTETSDAPYYNLGTRLGDTGGFSAIIGESLYAEGDGEVAIGGYNTPNVPDRIFSVGSNRAVQPEDYFRINAYGDVSLDNRGISSNVLDALGWSDAKDTSGGFTMTKINMLLGHIINRLLLFDQPLVTNANWSSGTLSVPGSSKYRMFEVVQGGAATICTRYGNDLRGFSLSGNSTANNWNQYVRAFGATADWSTEVWTLEWAKQLSHVTSSGYHTSGTTQAVTEIRGLIPLQNA